MNTINTPFTFDVRVRDRLVKRGQLDPKEIEKHLAALPDVGEKCVDLDIPQPALHDRSDDLGAGAPGLLGGRAGQARAGGENREREETRP